MYTSRYGDKLKRGDSDFPGEEALTQYFYDGLGKRRFKLVNSTDWTNYRWDRGWNMIAEYESGVGGLWDIGDLANTFIPGLAEVPGTNPATGDYRYYSTDHLGTVKGIRSQSQGTLAAYDYSPYGEPYYQAGLALNKAYTGHTWEAEIGQYYAPYRYYAPDLGRWLSRDPLGMVDGTNVYLYSLGSPIDLSDSLGLFTEADCEKAYEEDAEYCRSLRTKYKRNYCWRKAAERYAKCLGEVAKKEAIDKCVRKIGEWGKDAFDRLRDAFDVVNDFLENCGPWGCGILVL